MSSNGTDDVCAIDDVFASLTAAVFHDDANQRIFAAIVSLHDEGKPLGIILLVERLKDSGRP